MVLPMLMMVVLVLVDAVVVAAYIGVGVGAGFTISPTAVTCWVCFPSHSTYEY